MFSLYMAECMNLLHSLFQVQQLEKDIVPIQGQNRELSAKLDTITAERNALTAEVNKWKLRTNHLIEQCNKVDPDEHKKLM